MYTGGAPPHHHSRATKPHVRLSAPPAVAVEHFHYSQGALNPPTSHGQKTHLNSPNVIASDVIACPLIYYCANIQNRSLKSYELLTLTAN